MYRAILLTTAFVLAGAFISGCGGNGGGSMGGALGGALSNMTGGRLGNSGSKEAQLVKAGAQGLSAASFNDADAAEVGESVAVMLTSQYGVHRSDDLNRYVAKVGYTIAEVCPRSELQFTFGVLDTDEVNAFSMPRGYVFVTRGALAKMQDESELAGVLAHEVGHLVKEHTKKAIKANKAAEALVGAASANQPALFGQLADAGLELAKKPFSQPDETEADREAVSYLKLAGYDPSGLVRFLERVGGNSAGGLGNLLSTHPPTRDRVARLKTQIGSTSGVTLKDRFAASVKLK